MANINDQLEAFSTRLNVLEQVAERNDEEINILVDEIYTAVQTCPLDQFGDDELSAVTELSERIMRVKGDQ